MLLLAWYAATEALTELRLTYALPVARMLTLYVRTLKIVSHASESQQIVLVANVLYPTIITIYDRSCLAPFGHTVF